MRTSRLPLAGIVMFSLLAGYGTAAVAQTEEEAPAESAAVAQTEEEAPAESAEGPVVVTGTLECLAPTDDTATGQAQVNVHAWQASDPRLSGEVEYTGRWQLYAEPEEDRGTVDDAGQAAVYEIVNEGGGWLCEAARLAGPRTGETDHTLIFQGEGDYTGLTAYLNVDFSQAPYNFTGLILEGEEPPYAEPQG